MSMLKEVVIAVGGVSRAAEICGVSPRAIYKWLSADLLPRTEYTGETRYAESLAKKAGPQFDPKNILAEASPKKLAA